MGQFNKYTADQVAEIVRAALNGHVDAAIAGALESMNVHDDGIASPNEIWCDAFANDWVLADHIISRAAQRNDTTTAAFQQQLEALLSKMYDRPYAPLKSRQLIPTAPGIPSGAETVSTIGFDIKGEATVLASYGEDIPRVDLDGSKSTWNIVGLGAAWMLTIQQARAAALTGVDINSKGLFAAMNFIERKIDSLIWDGDSDLGIDGFLALTTGATGCPILNKTGTLTGDWDTGTAANALADFHLVYDQVTTDDIFVPTDCILDTTTYVRWMALKHGTDSDMSVMEYLSKKYDIQFHKLKKADTADSAGTGPRAVLYEKSDRVVEAIVSQEPEMFPSVWRGTGWETVAHARCGGVMVNNPRGICYADHKV